MEKHPETILKFDKPLSCRPPVYGNDSQNTFKESTHHKNHIKGQMMSKMSLMQKREGDGEGSENSSPPIAGFGTPPYVLWSKSMRTLLDDPEGLDLFRKFLERENCNDNMLAFWYACKGLKASLAISTSSEAYGIAKAIYKSFIKPSSPTCVQVSQDVRRIIERQIRTKSFKCSTIYNLAQNEVEHFMEKSLYPNFLQSETFIEYLQHVQQNSGCYPMSGSPAVDRKESGRASPGLLLATVPEDGEVQADVNNPKVTKLSSDTLKKRWKMSVAKKDNRLPEAEAGKYLSGAGARQPINPYHVTYSAYTPVSARDSERQSYSSGTHTDDTKSYADSSIIDVPINYAKKATHGVNKEKAGLPIIPRNPVSKTIDNPNNPDSFAKVLCDKLNKLKLQQAENQKLEAIKHLMEANIERTGQDILDSHVLKHFGDSKELSPSESPKCLDRFDVGCAPDGTSNSYPIHPSSHGSYAQISHEYSRQAPGGYNTIERRQKSLAPAAMLNPSNHDRMRDENLKPRLTSFHANVNHSLRKHVPKPTSATAPTPAAHAPPPVPTEYTIVGYQYSNEAEPYKTKIPGKNITLKQFKTVLNKKGKFRYFFKTVDTMFDHAVIKEEILDDNELCPLWDGKIFATIQPIE